jgi:hypothetical protein
MTPESRTMRPRDIAQIAFWLFVAISASYTAFQMAESIGLWVEVAQLIAAAVFTAVVLTVNKWLR